MYKVIEFDDSALGIVRSSWLTPRKKECLWPPYKLANKYNKCLVSQDSPDENWPIHAVKRVLYETDDLKIARDKCKKAESESDLQSDTSQQCKKRKRKPTNIFHDSDSEEDNENYLKITYPNPPSRPDETCKSKSSLLPEVNVDPQKAYLADASPSLWDITSPKSPATDAEKLFVPGSKVQFRTDDSRKESNDYSPSASYAHTSKARLALHSTVDDIPLTPRSLCSTPTGTAGTGSKPSAFDKINDSMELIASYLASIQSDIKELKATQNDILVRLTSSSSAALSNISLPDEITLPMKSFEDLGNIELWLENDDNKENLVTNLSFIGGNNVANITRRILQRLFATELAINCNWTGKNDKTSLKNLKLIPVIINAVRKNKLAEKATDSEITSFLTSWFRFARDRDGGRENRRARNSQ